MNLLIEAIVPSDPVTIMPATWGAAWIPVILGVIALLQLIVPTIQTIIQKGWSDARSAKTSQGIEEGKQAVVVLEKQINSNLEKQIEASIAKAIANERLRVAGLPASDPVQTAEMVTNMTTEIRKEKADMAATKTVENRLAALEGKKNP